MNKTEKHIVMFSGGLSSFLVSKIALEENENNKENVFLLFADTGWEHPDLFRFMNEVEILLQKQIIKLKHEKYNSIDDLFRDKKMLANNRMPICSKTMKFDVILKYIKENFNLEDVILYFGIDYSEQNRMIRIKERYDKLKIKTRFPLVERKIFFARDEIESILKKNNIEIPLLYKLGFSHNNCSGGCVRQGARYWKNLLDKLPEVYEHRENLELEFGHTFMENISLTKLREAKQMQLNLFEEMPCICFEV